MRDILKTMSEVERARKWEPLLVTLPPEDATEIRAEASKRRWPITLVLRELIKDGQRYRRDRAKGGEGR
jgi:PAS domain-containing protein